MDEATHAPHTALYHDPRCTEHDTGYGHPERAARYEAVLEALRAANVPERVQALPARLADDAEIGRCHTEAYLRTVKAEIEAGRSMLSTGDTSISEQSLLCARLAAGGVLNAVDAVLCEGPVRNAFCVTRPPGHHASARIGMGFCVFNSIAIGARHAQEAHGLRRVLIVDWDVHHGNGTQDIFYEDPSVLFFSTHQYPWYPGTGSKQETGRGAGKGTTINCPFLAGAGRREIVGAFQHSLLPAARRFEPELILISAGFDSRVGDPLGQFRLTDGDFAELTRILMELADELCEGKIVSVLEGGYALDGLASATTRHVETLIG